VKRVFHLFKPPDFAKARLDWSFLEGATRKSWQYASSGKACIHHILRALGGEGKILVPAYACQSILVPVRRLGLQPVYYDLDVEDLNGSVESIQAISTKEKAHIVLVASLYGNPANLIQIERFCRDQGLLLIDDAAQSFGAMLGGRHVGTFGDAGFFSFGPGKATAAHMGGAFWVESEYSPPASRHCAVHYARWLNFYFNRLRIYEYERLATFRGAVARLARFVEHRADLTNDGICRFEEPILGGVLSGLLNGAFAFRQRFHERFVTTFREGACFRAIQSIRGQPHNHKLVLLAQSAQAAAALKRHLEEHGIACLEGYAPLTAELSELPTLRSILGRVLELPIEDDRAKMDFLFERLSRFQLAV
jgi:hypothetical protein